MKDYNFEEEKFLKQLDEKLSLIITSMKMNATSNPDYIFLDNAEFIQFMKISTRTAQKWRDKKIIKYSIIGAKIYYTLSDIQKLINDHKNQNNYDGTNI